MENDKWQMSRAKPARSYLSFIIFHLSFVIFRSADSAENLRPRLSSYSLLQGQNAILKSWRQRGETFSERARKILRRCWRSWANPLIARARSSREFTAAGSNPGRNSPI